MVIADRKNTGYARKYEGDKLGKIRLLKRFVIFLFLCTLLFGFLIGIDSVEGNSMLPTVKSGQLVVFSRTTRDFHRGDVVVVRMPSGERLIKRVIAVGGDSLLIRDGKVFVNGQEESDRRVQGETTIPGVQSTEPYGITLEQGTVFVMGDNREVSVDSRSIGPIAESQLKGKVILLRH